MKNQNTNTITADTKCTQVLLRDTGKVLKVKTSLKAGSKATPILF